MPYAEYNSGTGCAARPALTLFARRTIISQQGVRTSAVDWHDTSAANGGPIALESFAGRKGMFNSGDTVEELATGRRGLVALSGVVGAPPNRWTVHFSDGTQPLIKDFTDPSELRLVKAVAEAGAPGLVPESWVV